MKKILFLSILIVSFSCQETEENNMSITGNIKGLKKGILYLQYIPDSILINIDSVEIDGDGSFTFSHEIENPEIFYLYLKKDDNNEFNDRITFFGEQGEIAINTTWNEFESSARITGSKSHEKLEECLDIFSKFNRKELEILRASQVEEIKNDSIALDSMQKLIDKNSMRRYLYALNFTMTNKDSYVAPYVLLTQADITTKKYLDSIYNNLTPRVSGSKYGKQLKDYIETLEE